jgi:hypothetical protein
VCDQICIHVRPNGLNRWAHIYFCMLHEDLFQGSGGQRGQGTGALCLAREVCYTMSQAVLRCAEGYAWGMGACTLPPSLGTPWVLMTAAAPHC